MERLPQDYCVFAVPTIVVSFPCTNHSGQFNFARALQRLELASTRGELESAGKFEKILLRNTPAVKAMEEMTCNNRRVDSNALKILGVGKCCYAVYRD